VEEGDQELREKSKKKNILILKIKFYRQSHCAVS
jgi:hypothetical protein